MMSVPSAKEQGYNDQKHGLRQDAIDRRANNMNPDDRAKYLAGVKEAKWDGHTHGQEDSS